MKLINQINIDYTYHVAIEEGTLSLVVYEYGPYNAKTYRN